MVLQKLATLASRLLSLIILPAQLPDDVIDMLEELVRAPLSTVRTWSPRVAWRLLRQLVRMEKLTLPNENQTRRLANSRQGFLSRGWALAPVRTADGFLLDAVIKEPPAPASRSGADAAPRFVIFVGGNCQKYEDWLGYYEVYARDVGCGFMAFNFRGVGNSEGAVTAAADLVADVAACVETLLQRGVQPQHLLLHGFSLGGAVAALLLASQPQRGICYVSDRSFRSLSRTAYGIVRGPPLPGSGRPTDGLSPLGAAAAATRGARLARAVGAWGRAVAGWIAVSALRACSWDLCAEEAWPAITSRKVLLYHPKDNVIHFAAASMYQSLLRSGHVIPTCLGAATDPSLQVIQVLRMGHKGWAAHDFPLCVDPAVWKELVRCVRAALQMTASR